VGQVLPALAALELYLQQQIAQRKWRRWEQPICFNQLIILEPGVAGQALEQVEMGRQLRLDLTAAAVVAALYQQTAVVAVFRVVGQAVMPEMGQAV
jgi:hypothetical protein